MARFTSPEQGRKKWEALHERFDRAIAKSFRDAMQRMERLSRRTLDEMVYFRPAPNRRAGLLRRSERLVMEPSGKAALLVNAASSVWKGVRTFYAHIVAKGRRAGDKGRKYYAWMKDPYMPRPATWRGWLEARKAGQAVLTHRTRAVAARPWRDRAIERARQQKLFTGAFARMTMEEVRAADGEAGG